MGDLPPGRRPHHGDRPRPRRREGRAEARRDAALSRVHGTQGGREAVGGSHPEGLHRLLHQRPHRGHPRGRGRCEGQEGCQGGARHGRPRLRAGQGAGGARGARQGPGRGRVRLARARLQHVPRNEPRQTRTRGALRLNLEPQLRGEAGAGRPHAPHVPPDGGGGGHQGHPHRRARHRDLRRVRPRARGRHAAQDRLHARHSRAGHRKKGGGGGFRGGHAQVHQPEGRGGCAGHPEHRHGHDHP
mmetsp:Transcript_30424/g.71062  ORF Transcript_30424/g.71062 Transcript_30424/m.71062 type:complete len:244 (+) Transcript_30424:1182-1913(+)